MKTLEVEPTLDRSTQSFSTCNVDLAAALVVDSLLTLESWDVSRDGKRLEFRFADPQDRGKSLEIAFQNSRDFRLFGVRKYLIDKTRAVTNPRR
jgi:hypothetical protein